MQSNKQGKNKKERKSNKHHSAGSWLHRAYCLLYMDPETGWRDSRGLRTTATEGTTQERTRWWGGSQRSSTDSPRKAPSILPGATLAADRSPSVQEALFTMYSSLCTGRQCAKTPLSVLNHTQTHWSTCFLPDTELVTLWALKTVLEEKKLTSYILTEFKKRNTSEIPKYETTPF